MDSLYFLKVFENNFILLLLYMALHIPCHKWKVTIKILPSRFISYIIRSVQTSLDQRISPSQLLLFSSMILMANHRWWSCRPTALIPMERNPRMVYVLKTGTVFVVLSFGNLVLLVGLSSKTTALPFLNFSFDICKMVSCDRKHNWASLWYELAFSHFLSSYHHREGVELAFREEKPDDCVVIGETSGRSLDFKVAISPNLHKTPDLPPLAT